jgi:membrane protease YdiL (CAAX protease family)
LLLWAASFAAAAACGLVTAPALGLGLLTGPAIGAGLFLVLAGGLPRLPRRPPRIVAGRAGYLLAAAVFEELIWRGLALGMLLNATGPPAALVLTSIGFALWHRRALGRRSAVHVATGAGFGVAFLVGGLVAAILAHAVYNVLVDISVQAERRLRAR